MFKHCFFALGCIIFTLVGCRSTDENIVRYSQNIRHDTMIINLRDTQMGKSIYNISEKCTIYKDTLLKPLIIHKNTIITKLDTTSHNAAIKSLSGEKRHQISTQQNHYINNSKFSKIGLGLFFIFLGLILFVCFKVKRL